MARKDFTIIELLLIISTIAVLIGIVIPRFKEMRSDVNITKIKVELSVLQKAIESYNMNQEPNAYPTSSATICATTLNNANPLIVSEVLIDKFSATEYNYINNGDYYVIFSKGPDGKADITGINAAGYFTGVSDDDIYVSNGKGFRGELSDEYKMYKVYSELTILQKAIESYYRNQEPNAYPASSTRICSTALNSASPLIVDEVLADPFTINEYNYINNGAYYIIFSNGHDGVADITGINAAGYFTGVSDDDPYVSNGKGFEKK